MKSRSVNCLIVDLSIKATMYQKSPYGGIFKNIYSGIFLKIVTKVSAMDFYLVISCVWSMTIILWEISIVNIQTTFRLAAWNYNRLIAKTLAGNAINESCKFYFCQKRAKNNVFSCFRIGQALWFCKLIFVCPIPRDSCAPDWNLYFILLFY